MKLNKSGLEKSLEEFFSAQDKVTNLGYARIMNDIIDYTVRATVWSAGYRNRDDIIGSLECISSLYNRISDMISSEERKQQNYYADNLVAIGIELDKVLKSFKEKKDIVMEMYSEKMIPYILSLIGDRKTIAKTVGKGKDKVNKKPLEIIKEGLSYLDSLKNKSSYVYIDDLPIKKDFYRKYEKLIH